MCHDCRNNAARHYGQRLAEQPAGSAAPQRTFGAVVGLESVVPQRPAPPAIAVCECGAEPTVTVNNTVYCDGCAGGNCRSCTDCGIWVANSEIKENGDSEAYCEDCFDEAYTTCHSCNGCVSKDNCMTSSNGDDYCESCYSDKFSSCEDCSEECETEDMTDVGGRRDSRYVCQHCRDNNYTRCNDCGRYSASDDSTTTASGDSICQRCYENNYFTCEGCSETLHTDDYAQDGYCNSCHGPEHDEDDEDCSCRDCEATRRATRQRQAAARLAAAQQPASVKRTRSARRYGVELETSDCPDWSDLPGTLPFTGKSDGSIDGKEFVSDVLKGDEGLDGIKGFCEFANRNGWAVDAKCGFHAHFDVGDLDDEQLKAVAIAYRLTYNVWRTFVSEARRNNEFAGPNTWTVSEVRYASSFADFGCKFDGACGSSARLDRYQWLNLASWKKHGTIESRIHSGTLNASKVQNWVLANLRFIDAVAKMTVDEVIARFDDKDEQSNFAALAEIWADAELTEFYAGRALKFGTVYTQAADSAESGDDCEFAQELAARGD